MLIKFKEWHLDMMRISDTVRDVLGKYPSKEVLGRLAEAGLAYTVVADSPEGVKILGTVGAVPVKDGRTAEVFVVVAEERHQHPVAFVRDVKTVLECARQQFRFVEAIAAEGVPVKWFESLGFYQAGEGRWRLATGRAG